MSKLIKQHEDNMVTILRNSGYSVQVKINTNNYRVTVPAIDMSGHMVLTYPDTLTPGEVVYAVKTILDKLNGK
jgi:hypothetical protein